MAQPNETATALIDRLGGRARAAAWTLALSQTQTRNRALLEAAKALRQRTDELLAANASDLAAATAAGRPAAFIDRLALDAGRIEAMAQGVEAVAGLPDPVGRRLFETRRPNGLLIERIATPIGVIGMVYESRPNVGADAGTLCVKSGNAVILRGGADAAASAGVVVACMRAGLDAAGLPADAVQQVETADRDAVRALLECAAHIDLVIPRGGRSLVELVRDVARVPTLLHLEGNCQTYIHESADPEKAIRVVRNAKLRRTGVCGATEGLVIDRAIAPALLPAIVDALEGCEFRGDPQAIAIEPRIASASNADWDTEYLDAILSVKIVEGLDEGVRFVAAHSSGHTDAIIAEDTAAAERFLREIDSAVVMHNASTQFSDGGEFGMGAEIGIATGKIHARGPVGLEQLTTFKYIVRGDGQTRI